MIIKEAGLRRVGVHFAADLANPHPTFRPLCGWLSPLGVYYPVRCMMHMAFIYDLINEQPGEWGYMEGCNTSAFHQEYAPLIQRGWLHIGYDWHETYGWQESPYVERFTITEPQLTALHRLLELSLQLDNRTFEGMTFRHNITYLLQNVAEVKSSVWMEGFKKG